MDCPCSCITSFLYLFTGFYPIFPPQRYCTINCHQFSVLSIFPFFAGSSPKNIQIVSDSSCFKKKRKILPLLQLLLHLLLQFLSQSPLSVVSAHNTLQEINQWSYWLQFISQYHLGSRKCYPSTELQPLLLGFPEYIPSLHSLLHKTAKVSLLKYKSKHIISLLKIHLIQS